MTPIPMYPMYSIYSMYSMYPMYPMSACTFSIMQHACLKLQRILPWLLLGGTERNPTLSYILVLYSPSRYIKRFLTFVSLKRKSED